SLMKEKSIFKTIYIPGGGSFFEKNGLLFLSIEELEALTDNLAQAQPFLALLSQDLSLKGLFSVLETFLRHSEEVMGDKKKLVLLFDRLSDAFEHAINRDPYRLSWQEIMIGEQVKKSQLRQFIVLQPFLDYSVLYPAKQAIQTIHRIADELQLNDENGVKIRITGSIALNHEDLINVQEGIGTAAVISLILVGVVLYIGLYSGGLVFISLVTLITGLIWTMGFAIVATGSLNLISITFVVLFIGLGIDYSVQVCLRYKELIELGVNHRDAIPNAVKGVGNALLLCTITTAIGFYAFVPTAYAGASELGMISGTGMFINFFANIAILPALLHLTPLKKGKNRPLSISKRLLILPDKYAGMIAAGAIILGLVAAALLPKVYFDFNPLNLSNQSAESVVTAKELFKSGKTSPWTISILAGNLTQAKQLASELRGLKEVERAITIADFIPENQTEKLDIVSDMALFMPHIPQDAHLSPRDYAHTIAALESFEATL
ncbi:MMPL family transporter, partial [bacterium]|nr:MMPL family transporter [bacterium]